MIPDDDLHSKIRAILCDVGDVILLFDKAVAAQIEFRHGLADGALLAQTLKSAAGRQAMTGDIGFDEWRRRAGELLSPAAVDDWLDYHGELNADLVHLLAAARENGIAVYLLSNATTRLWLDLASHGIEQLADRVFCSAEIRLAKPDARAYRFVAEEVATPLEQMLYVDDTASWVDAAARLGLRGHVYVGPQSLKAELCRWAVLA